MHSGDHFSKYFLLYNNNNYVEKTDKNQKNTKVFSLVEKQIFFFFITQRENDRRSSKHKPIHHKIVFISINDWLFTTWV